MKRFNYIIAFVMALGFLGRVFGYQLVIAVVVIMFITSVKIVRRHD